MLAYAEKVIENDVTARLLMLLIGIVTVDVDDMMDHESDPQTVLEHATTMIDSALSKLDHDHAIELRAQAIENIKSHIDSRSTLLAA